MKSLKHSHGSAGQSRTPVKTSQKHDANLQKNTTLYFQVGLILALLMTWGLFEMQFSVKDIVIPEHKYIEEDDVVAINFREEKPQPQAEVVKQAASKVITKTPRVVPNTVSMNLTQNSLATTAQNTQPDLGMTTEFKPKKAQKETIHNVTLVDKVPVYPGCEGLESNSELLNCMSRKLGNLVQRKFNTDLVQELGLSKKQKIWVLFKIDKSGAISDIQARSVYDALQKEAIKVANKIPPMTPAVQGGKEVSVMYSLPISLQIQY